ncbi:hypothetical protein VZH09_07535 [Synechococcus elongatus IITB7]|uniref:hypothetical protein n=1 Tax=Synechococcus elongatus TaxID=32046 RepID=UPI0030CBDA3B
MRAIATVLIVVLVMALSPAEVEQRGWLRVWQEGNAQQWLDPQSVVEKAGLLRADSVFFPEVGEPVTYRSLYRLAEGDYQDLDADGEPLHEWRSLADDPFNQAVFEAASRWARTRTRLADPA